jgi:hypothetical protein
MPYMTLEEIEDTYPDDLDPDDWDEYAPDSRGKLWVSRVKGMLRVAARRNSPPDKVVYYYRGYPLGYDPGAGAEARADYLEAYGTMAGAPRDVLPWVDLAAAGFGGETAEEIKTAIDRRLD